MTDKEIIHHDDVCIQESRITTVEQQVTTIFHNQDKLEGTLEKLDETLDKLVVSNAELSNTFKVLKIIGGLLTALFGGAVVFMVTELIKMIH